MRLDAQIRIGCRDCPVVYSRTVQGRVWHGDYEDLFEAAIASGWRFTSERKGVSDRILGDALCPIHAAASDRAQTA